MSYFISYKATHNYDFHAYNIVYVFYGLEIQVILSAYADVYEVKTKQAVTEAFVLYLQLQTYQVCWESISFHKRKKK